MQQGGVGTVQNKQGNLFGKGDEWKAEGMARVLANTPHAYEVSFRHVIRTFRPGFIFSCEDVTAIVGMPPNSHNGVGALMSGAANSGLIKAVGKNVKARRSVRHSGESKLWVRTDS